MPNRFKEKHEWDERGFLVNTPCKACEAMGRDPLSHIDNLGRPSCRAHRRKHDLLPCKHPVRAGHATCINHGANVRGAIVKAERRLALAQIRQELTAMGGQIDIDPGEAMLIMVKEAAFNVAFLRTLVEQLQQGWGDEAQGLVGFEDHGKGGMVQREHILVEMYDKERDRLVRYAKMCRDAGIEERKVAIMEEQGRWLTRTLDLVLESLQLSDDQLQRLPEIMRGVIGKLELEEAQIQQAGDVIDVESTEAEPAVDTSDVRPAPAPPPWLQQP